MEKDGMEKDINGKGKCKEYSYFGELLFDGQYSKGQKNGQGKEFNSFGKLIFIGEYLNGKRWEGKLKEYYGSGFLKYEKEIFNGKINGKAKEYYKNGHLKFVGEYLNDKINGKCKEYFYCPLKLKIYNIIKE